MRTIKQLFRQPVKSIIGITLMALAAAILCLCVGQALAARTTKETLNQRFSTVGIPLLQEDLDGNTSLNSFLLEAEFIEWMEQVAREHPDIVKLAARHAILNAYIPELTPLNITSEKYIYYKDSTRYSYQSDPYSMPYSCAMLVITLEEVGEPAAVTVTYPVENLTEADFETEEEYEAWYNDPETAKMTATQGYSVALTGTITGVVSMADGYRDPVGRVARLSYTATTLEQIEGLNLVPGQQYIVYGMDYVDAHWELISELNPDGLNDYKDLENYNPELFRFLTEEEIRDHQGWAEAYPDVFGYRKYLIAEYNLIQLTYNEYLQLNASFMTLDTPVSLIPYEPIRDERTGTLLELRPQTQITYTDCSGETVSCSLEEYAQRYSVPTIARLDGTLEDFLNSQEGAAWKNALQVSTINNQAFVTVGVNRMDYLADFSLERAHIVAGRDFTDEEHASGSRVCIIHDAVAEASGLSIGDTITLNLYGTDYGLPYQDTFDDGKGILNPSASFYFDTTPFAETAEYTIIGFWHSQRSFPDVANVSEYGFSANTVFVPKNSVQTQMELGDSILLNTIVPQNGKITEFHELAKSGGYAGRFKYHDQGYSTIAANFHNYDALAKQMLVIGLVLYTVLLLLFLLLFPGSQKNNVRTMQSFGAGFPRRLWHITATSMGIAIPASLLGGWLGKQLWGRLVNALQATAESAIALQIEPGTLTAVAAAQLLFALLLTLCVAVFVAAPRGMSARR